MDLWALSVVDFGEIEYAAGFSFMAISWSVLWKIFYFHLKDLNVKKNVKENG